MRTIDPEKFARKQGEILDAAGRCFARDGFHGASISSICAEAEISPGHLYHYFASKEAIVGAIIESSLANAVARFDRVVQSDDLVEAIIAEIEDVRGERCDAEPKVRLVQEMMAEGGRNPAIAGLLAKHHSTIRDLLSELLRRAQARGQVERALDPDAAAAVLLGVLESAGTLAIYNPTLDPARNNEHLKMLIKRFLTPWA